MKKPKKIQYHFRALDKAGHLAEGTASAIDEFELQKELKVKNLNLLSAEPVSKFSLRYISKQVENFGTVSMHEKIIFSRNLSSMIEAGLSASRALEVIAKQASNPKLKMIITQINGQIKKGTALSEALSEYPKTFSPLMISMVQAGEESGNLVQALDVIAEQMEKTYTLKKKIRGAMVYPGVIMGAMLVIGVFMMIYIVPTLTKTFMELQIDLPSSTKLIINFSDFLQNNLLTAIVGLAAVIALFWGFGKTAVGSRLRDWFFLHTPIIAPLVKEINAARTTRTLSSLLSAGVPFVRALQIVGEVMQNSYYKEVIKKAEKNIQVGLPISKVFREAESLYPIFVAEMMLVGEETGELGGMLLKVAHFYEDEVDQKTKNMSTIVEPFLMIIVGALVGFFALSMITPMYSLVENI
jgi:type IV pilus assembly protein PilC